METKPINGMNIYYDSAEKKAVDQLAQACERSIQTIENTWNLATPRNCRVYLMDSWPRCVFLGAPLGSQILLGLTLPLWYRDFKMRWLHAGGWSQRYGTRQIVGIKAPRLIAETPVAMGESLFVKEEDLEQKFLSIVCHELTHACSAHLDLPNWFNEGLAMVSVDRCLEKQTVLPGTLELLNNKENGSDSEDRLNMKTQSREEIILLYVRGYWLTRYLVDTRPELVTEILSGRIVTQEIDLQIAAALDIPQDKYWQMIDPILVSQFKVELP